MSKLCRICGEEIPEDRKGWEQICPECREKGHKELYDENTSWAYKGGGQ